MYFLVVLSVYISDLQVARKLTIALLTLYRIGIALLMLYRIGIALLPLYHVSFILLGIL